MGHARRALALLLEGSDLTPAIEYASSAGEELWPLLLERAVASPPMLQVGLYKIFFCFWDCGHESILFFAHPPFV